jgi:hypothetical protein
MCPNRVVGLNWWKDRKRGHQMCWQLLRKLKLVLVEERPRIVVLRLKIMKFCPQIALVRPKMGGI